MNKRQNSNTKIQKLIDKPVELSKMRVNHFTSLMNKEYISIGYKDHENRSTVSLFYICFIQGPGNIIEVIYLFIIEFWVKTETIVEKVALITSFTCLAGALILMTYMIIK